MPRIPTTLFATILTVTASGVRAEDVATLPSHICRTSLFEEALGTTQPGTSRNEATRLADERWTRAYATVLARCQAGDILVLTQNPVDEALRACDWDRPVHLRPSGGTICTYAGGVREAR